MSLLIAWYRHIHGIYIRYVEASEQIKTGTDVSMSNPRWYAHIHYVESRLEEEWG